MSRFVHVLHHVEKEMIIIIKDLVSKKWKIIMDAYIYSTCAACLSTNTFVAAMALDGILMNRCPERSGKPG